VGNGSGVRTEVYVLDSRKPTTLASPPGGNVTGPVSVTLTCDDAGGTGCNGTWYTVYRIGNADTDARSDWTVGTGSLGLPNT